MLGPAGEPADFDWITPHLAVGAAFPARAVPALAQAGLKAVIDLRSEAHDDPGLLARNGLAFLHLPVDDLLAVRPAQLDQGVAFTQAHLDRGEPVLIHCREGIGRSVTLMLAVLVAQGLEPLTAMTRIKDRRRYASPSPAQFEAWAEWLTDREIPAPRFEDFAAIAYRHLAR
jgi:protein-tyrosine phosphatase